MSEKTVNSLSDEWGEAPLKDVVHVVLGQSPSSSTYNEEGKGLPFFQGKTEFGEIYPTVKKWCTEPKKVAEKDDVLISVRAPMRLTNLAPSECAIGRGLVALRPIGDSESKYYLYLIRRYQIELAAQGTGTTFEAISGNTLKNFVVPIAPLKQQKRIVDKIEKLFSHIDAGIKALQKAKQLLKQYRQSVLKAAVTGELTKEWRKANKDKLEPASQLLERILKERRRKWEVQQLKQFKAKGKMPKDDMWKRKYKEPDVPDNNDLPAIPNEWLWSGFEQVSSPQKNGMKAGPFGSVLKKQFYVEEGYKIYGQEQVISGDPYFGNYYINEERYQSLINCSVQPGDFLISLVGTIGRTLVLPDDIEPGIINPRLIKITFDKEFCLPEYMQIYIASPAARQIFKLSSHGGTMDVLNMGTLKALPLPLPSVSEQQVIVEIANEKEEAIERQLKYIDGQLLLIKKNKQAILASAFSDSLNSM